MVAEPVPTSPPSPPPPPSYPIQVDIQRPETQSRITNFPLFGSFIRLLLVIPNAIVYYFVAAAAQVVFLVATVAILFTGRYPRGLFNFAVGANRWSLGLSAYLFSLNDTYPAFSISEGKYPATFTVEYPEHSSRILNFPIFGMFIKALMLLPNIIVLYFVILVAELLVFIGQFAILFTGSFPAGMHSFAVGAVRWQFRTTGYMLALTDRYPPFSLK